MKTSRLPCPFGARNDVRMVYNNCMRQGFTLIELMVTVAIGIVLVGVGVVSMTKFLSREHMASARTEILSAVKLARNYAVTDQKPSTFSDQLDLVAVTIGANGQLSVWPVNLISGTGASYLTENVSSNGAIITPVDYGELLFSVPEGKLLMPDGITPVGSGDTVAVLISSAEGVAETMTVSVDAGGKIW